MYSQSCVNVSSRRDLTKVSYHGDLVREEQLASSERLTTCLYLTALLPEVHSEPAGPPVLAFQLQVKGFGCMQARKESRHKAVLPVRLVGKGATDELMIIAHTYDISREGVRLGGVKAAGLTVGEIVTLERRGRRAKFEVRWCNNETVGLFCLEPIRELWHLDGVPGSPRNERSESAQQFSVTLLREPETATAIKVEKTVLKEVPAATIPGNASNERSEQSVATTPANASSGKSSQSIATTPANASNRKPSQSTTPANGDNRGKSPMTVNHENGNKTPVSNAALGKGPSNGANGKQTHTGSPKQPQQERESLFKKLFSGSAPQASTRPTAAAAPSAVETRSDNPPVQLPAKQAESEQKPSN